MRKWHSASEIDKNRFIGVWAAHEICSQADPTDLADAEREFLSRTRPINIPFSTKRRTSEEPFRVMHIYAFHFVAGGVPHSGDDDGTCNTQTITVLKWNEIAFAEPVHVHTSHNPCSTHCAQRVCRWVELTVHFFGKNQFSVGFVFYSHMNQLTTGSRSIIIEFHSASGITQNKSINAQATDASTNAECSASAHVCICRWPQSDYWIFGGTANRFVHW